MQIENIWNNIVDWFNDRSERGRLIRSFNAAARESFIQGIAHQFSSWMNSGFRIQALSGRPLTKDEMTFIGQTILSDTMLIRRLIALGWDTLEVHDDSGIYGCRWKIIDYASMGGLLT